MRWTRLGLVISLVHFVCAYFTKTRLSSKCWNSVKDYVCAPYLAVLILRYLDLLKILNHPNLDGAIVVV